MNKVAERIIELELGNDMSKIYRELRSIVEEEHVQKAGVEVYRQEAIRGNHKFTYHFSDCERTIEVWQEHFLSGDVFARVLIHQVIRAVENNQTTKATFPKRLFESLKKYIEDTK